MDHVKEGRNENYWTVDDKKTLSWIIENVHFY